MGKAAQNVVFQHILNWPHRVTGEATVFSGVAGKYYFLNWLVNFPPDGQSYFQCVLSINSERCAENFVCLVSQKNTPSSKLPFKMKQPNY